MEPYQSRSSCQGKTTTTSDDFDDIKQQLPNIDNSLAIGFLNRIAYSFRLLGQIIFLHDVDPIATDFPKLFNLPENDLRNEGIKEKLWFMLSQGAEAPHIEEFLNNYRLLED